jgi:hypothetical protein
MLAEESSGGTWTVQSLPSPTGSLTTSLEGVSCPSPTTCTAVGSYQLTDGSNLTLVETSSGSSWSIQPMTRTKGEVFADVSCYGTSGCEAIGDHFETSGEKTLAEGWSGTSWSVQSIPSSTGSEADSLAGISCFSMSTCTAVGNYSTLGSPSQAALAEGWNGAKWALQKTPATAAALDSVSCPATDWCTAVGSDPDTSSTLVQAWNGKKWSVETTPAAPGSPADLNGVSCVSATDCTAVGYYNAGESYATLVEAWNGTKWSIVASPSPGGNGFDDFSELTGVWCFSSTSCVAVGTDGDFSSLTTLVEIWNGSTWTVQTSPNPTSASESTLSAISCASATDCMAVGVYTGTSGNLTLAEIWNGTTWAVKSTPNPAGASDSQLVGVSCDSSTCAAVGQSTAGDGTVTPLAEGFDGTSWTLESVATPAGASSGYFSAVACPAGAPCTAVGQYTDAAGETHALVENQS